MCRSQTYSNSLVRSHYLLNNVSHLVEFCCMGIKTNVPLRLRAGKRDRVACNAHFTLTWIIFILNLVFLSGSFHCRFSIAFIQPHSHGTWWTFSFMWQLVNTKECFYCRCRYCTILFVLKVLFCMLQSCDHVLKSFSDSSDCFNTMVLALCSWL